LRQKKTAIGYSGVAPLRPGHDAQNGRREDHWLALLSRNVKVLEYSSPGERRTSTARGLVVFAPAVIEVGVISACSYWNNYSASTMVVMATFCIAEVTTISLLIVWRRRLGLVPIVLGWLLAALGVAIVGFALAMAFY